MDQNRVTEKVFHLTLEVISLLTGESFPPMMSGFLGNAAVTPPPREKSHKEKILKVIQKMIELLTGEVPVRYQDVAVYLTMEEREYLEGHSDLYQAAMMEEPQTFHLTNMEDLQWNEMMLNLSLEIICLLTGEEYTKVKTSLVTPESARRTSRRLKKGSILVPPTHLIIPERSQRKILDFTNDMLELLLGEVPIRYQDVAVYLTMEEREYLEGHQERYKAAMMEEHKSGIPRDGMTARHPAEVTRTPRMLPGKTLERKVTGPDNGRLPLCSRRRKPAAPGVSPAKHNGRSSCHTSHGLRRDGKKLPCPECDKSFKSNLYLKSHQRIHTDERPFPCADCGKRFRRRTHLLRHQSQHAGGAPHTCLECGKSFTRREGLEVHQSLHTGKWPFSCSECGRGFVQKSGLDLHLRGHTGVRPYSCPECSQCFTRKSYLVQHQAAHAGAFSCSKCERRYSEKKELVKHEKTHAGEFPHVCPECNRGFIRKHTLTNHLRTHTGERPFSCPECGKTFAQKYSLTQHVKIHTGCWGRFPCSECDKCFKAKSQLKVHQRVHTGARPYLCPACGKCFSQRTGLRLHLQKQHADALSSENAGTVSLETSP